MIRASAASVDVTWPGGPYQWVVAPSNTAAEDEVGVVDNGWRGYPGEAGRYALTWSVTDAYLTSSIYFWWMELSDPAIPDAPA